MKSTTNNSQIINSIKKSLLLTISLLMLVSASLAQKVNPDITGTKVKTKTEVIYESVNKSHSQLSCVKSVIDSKGTKYVLFNDTEGGTAYLATETNGNWKTEVVAEVDQDDETKGIKTYYLAMDIDKNDGLHIILVGSTPHVMNYGYRAAGSSKWTFTELSQKKTPQLHKFYVFADLMDMAVDKFGGVHVVISTDIDYGKSSMYFYKTPDGKWSNEIVRLGIKNSKKDYGNDPSIIVNDEKVMMIFGGGWSFSYAEKNIGDKEWKVEEIINEEKDSEPQKLLTDITLTPEDKPVISFREYNVNDFRGVNVITKSDCENKWIRSSLNDPSLMGNAIAVDKYGVFWLAYCNDGDYTKLAYRSCTADRSFKDVIKIVDRSRIFMDMNVDANNHVHLFYSTYEDEIKHIEAWFEGDPGIDNNIMPAINSKMKPNIKTGDFWKTTLKAYDPECDNITFYYDNLPDGFTLTDHGNGLATLKSGKINTVGDYKLKIFVTDDNHIKGTKPVSGINVTLKVSKNGDKKGSCKVFFDEGSFSKNKWVGLDGVSEQIESTETQTATTGTMINSDNALQENQPAATQTSSSSSDCKEYLDRFEEWANKYIKIKKKVNSNPMDFGSVSKLAALAPELGNWGLEWQQKHECGNDPEFMERFENINARIEEVNQ
nr:hypothetical protein [uncultured Sphaerochaeta sp.]